ncbi:hypothetical protein BD560DRAFT_331702 [Blakeslea trispora]|nr:hypothetical protein BD560DRAFT_331702 [Blakeslea trispora]
MCERLNGTIAQSLKKLSIQHPSVWDLHLPGILYAYRTKAHGIIKISPFELLYGQPPRAPRQDALQVYGQSLAYDRTYKLMDKNLREDDINDYPFFDNEFEPNSFNKSEVGNLVLRKRHKKTNKLSTKFEPEIFTVVANNYNGSYQLADGSGKLLKRSVNGSSLVKFHPRTGLQFKKKDNLGC